MTKNKTWKMLLTVFLVGFLTACGDDDNNPFAGVDNNILSFSLSQGEETWQAAIVDDKIILSVPQGTELNGAAAHYAISEQASITPDPAGISAWNEEQQLTVTSYSGSSRTYKYTVRHTDVSEAGSFTLNSQTEVDAFAKSNITIIEGSLSIATTQNTEDPIKNLDGLSALTEVLDDINIGKFYQGENLNGLASLKKAGSLTILSSGASIETLTDITLSSLISVRKNFLINENKYYKKVSFPYLESVGGTFTINASVMEQLNVNSLKKVDNNFTIKGGLMTQLEMPALEIVNGTFTISGDNSTTKLQTINFPLLTACASLTVEKAAKLENLNIPELKSLTSNLSLNSCANFNDESLKNTLANIESIGGTLLIRDTGVFTLNLQGKKVGKVDIAAKEPEKEFIITGEEPFGSITFSSASMNPPTLKGFTTVENYTLQTNIEEGLTIKDIKHINGNLSVQYRTIQGMATSVLHDIHLPDLEYVGGDISISALNADVPTEPFEFPQLKEIGGSLTLYIHNSQKDFSFIKMDKLETIGGQFSIQPKTSSSIAKLNIKEIFPNLNHVSKVRIWNFKNLYDFSSFHSFIKDGITTGWQVYNCGLGGFKPSLQDMKDSQDGDFTNK